MKTCAIVAATFLITSTTALAAGPYVGTGAGISLVSHDNSFEQIFGNSDAIGLSWNANAGYDFGGYRIDGEYGYKWLNYTLSSGRIESYMINAYRDFGASLFSPFIGAGAGIVKGRIEDEGSVAKDSSVALQFTFGVQRRYSERLTGSIYYRYERALSDFSSNGNKIPYGSANLSCGLRYNF